jgi:hypothetical protein
MFDICSYIVIFIKKYSVSKAVSASVISKSRKKLPKSNGFNRQDFALLPDDGRRDSDRSVAFLFKDWTINCPLDLSVF